MPPSPAEASERHGELTLTSRQAVTPTVVRAATVLVRDGLIVEVGAYVPDGAAGEGGEDLGDAVLLPGLVDPHVHLNEPGRTEWEGFATGTQAAAAGGVTTLIDMPLNSSPVTTTVEALRAKRAAAEGKLWVDVGFHAGLVPGNEGEIAALLDAGVRGVKAFLCHSGIDEFPAAGERELRAVMPLLAERGVPLLAHAEIAKPTAPMADPRRYADYQATRPPEFEREAIAMLIDLCRETGCKTHVVHLADAGSLPTLAAARAEGLPLTVETCPHYLTFCSEEISEGATAFKCAPPIRGRANREALWEGLRSGVIDFIATDHSPCPPDLKYLDEGRFDLAWGGISSLQIGLPVVWTEASRRGFDLADVVRWMSAAPAQLVNVATGITPGATANFVVFDPDAAWTVRGAELHHRWPVTPYEGYELRGVVRRTYVRGRVASSGGGTAL